MNKAILLILLVILVSALSLGQATKEKTSSAQWEYKFDYSASEKKANELGSQGWELIAIQSTGPGLGNNVATYVYKRLKQN
jgi:hypothetical protein